jgi:ADP-ribose pyrophosphatase YjhB (NUDIX family)
MVHLCLKCGSSSHRERHCPNLTLNALMSRLTVGGQPSTAVPTQSVNKYAPAVCSVLQRFNSHLSQVPTVNSTIGGMYLVNRIGFKYYILMQRRSDALNGKYSTPGGSCNPGENSSVAAYRECMEETGCVVE